MSLTDYLLNGLLVGLVLLQIRGRKLTRTSFVLPLVIVGVVAKSYLHSIPTAGNDLLLICLCAAAGLLLGTGAGWFTRLHRGDDGSVIARAGIAAAALWVLGVGARLAFEIYATHGGGAAVYRFSAAHAITASTAWTAALVLMAIAEVLARTAVLRIRMLQLPKPAMAATESLSPSSTSYMMNAR